MASRFQQTGIEYYVKSLLKVTSPLVLLLSVIVHADVLSCTDSKGKMIYTDNRENCKGVQTKSTIKGDGGV